MGIRLKALIIDDDQIQRVLLKKILKRYLSLDVLEAENGDVALRMVRQERPDLVILDVMMPVMDGLGFLAAIREEPDFASLPVIVSSAVTEKAMILRLLELKVTDYLLKPLRQAQVIERLTPIVDRLESARQADSSSPVLRSGTE